MKITRHLLALLGICVCLNAAGSTKGLQLNGAASYNDLGKERFMAALYLEQPSASYQGIVAADTARRMEMRLTSRYSKRRWTNLWMQGIAISNSSQRFSAMSEALVELFNKQRGGLQPGDVVALDCNAENGCAYSINGVALASGLPADLFPLFINAWIGRAPPATDFRDAILGKNVDIARLAVRLDGIAPSAGRVAAVKSWLGPAPEQLQPNAEQQAAAGKAAGPASLAGQQAEIPTRVDQLSGTEGDPVANALAAITESAQQEGQETISVQSVLALQQYIEAVKKQIYKAIRYPSAAIRLGYEGQVRVQLEVSRSGELVTVAASQKSKYKSLNRAALRAVKKAAPYSVVPNEIVDEPLSIIIPISFKLVD